MPVGGRDGGGVEARGSLQMRKFTNEKIETRRGDGSYPKCHGQLVAWPE